MEGDIKFRLLYEMMCDASGHPAGTMAAVFSRVMMLLFGLIFSISFGVMMFLIVSKKLDPNKEPKEKDDTFPRSKAGHTIFTTSISFACFVLGTICAACVPMSLVLKVNVKESFAPLYTEMAIRFGVAAVLQFICIIVTTRWENIRATEDAIYHTIIPAMYHTLSDNLTPEEAHNTFLMVLPIIDNYICGKAWDLLIDSAKANPDTDGSEYLRIVLDVIYAKNATKQGSPYTVMFTDAQRKVVDLIKLRVFKYPSVDTPWH